MKFFKGGPIWMIFLHWLRVCNGEGFLIKNVRLGKCIHVSLHETERIGLSDCKAHSQLFWWGWDVAARAIVSLKTRQCLTVHKPEEFAAAQLEPCGGHVHQAWGCSKKGHLTLQGMGLHLSTQQGGHKAFLSREKDKFSRWKTWMDEIICTRDLPVAPGPSYPTEKSVVPWERVLQTKVITSAKTPTLPGDPTTTSATPTLETEPDATSALPSTEEITMEPEVEKHTHFKKHAGNQKKTASAHHPGTNWKTVMLVLSPLAFILGLVILALNIHYNKKKKTTMLSALKRRPDKSHQGSYEERLPFSSASHKTQIIPSSPSPSLKHGEILIEWKDGTITPLFDHMNYPIC
ncbi:uncharacterized protein LOC129334905 [Eublepharis macularius]|uniref:Uncharacterized protein LOC129334905 n=1 Tax=Eublepharis macularius TaxID=481883 RepID=A0AA97JS80_EUBMA|nr:uncharacterized protein LOC129334905 [Eublepharis macularius]